MAWCFSGFVAVEIALGRLARRAGVSGFDDACGSA